MFNCCKEPRGNSAQRSGKDYSIAFLAHCLSFGQCMSPTFRCKDLYFLESCGFHEVWDLNSSTNINKELRHMKILATSIIVVIQLSKCDYKEIQMWYYVCVSISSQFKFQTSTNPRTNFQIMSHNVNISSFKP